MLAAHSSWALSTQLACIEQALICCRGGRDAEELPWQLCTNPHPVESGLARDRWLAGWLADIASLDSVCSRILSVGMSHTRHGGEQLASLASAESLLLAAILPMNLLAAWQFL